MLREAFVPNTGAADVEALQAFWCMEGFLVETFVSQTQPGIM